jgi:hypothetical protein
MTAIQAILDGFKKGNNISQIWKGRRNWLKVCFGVGRERQIRGEIEKGAREIPWFIKCNPKRYQYFFGTEIDDQRLEMGNSCLIAAQL